MRRSEMRRFTATEHMPTADSRGLPWSLAPFKNPLWEQFSLIGQPYSAGPYEDEDRQETLDTIRDLSGMRKRTDEHAAAEPNDQVNYHAARGRQRQCAAGKTPSAGNGTSGFVGDARHWVRYVV